MFQFISIGFSFIGREAKLLEILPLDINSICEIESQILETGFLYFHSQNGTNTLLAHWC